MKKLYIFFICILFSIQLIAQDSTLISGKLESGGYGAPVVKFTQVKNQFALFVGGYGGWLINHTFLIGGGGYGLVNKINYPEGVVLDQFIPYYEKRILFGYGGLVLEYIGNHSRLIHYSVSTLIGAGGLSYYYENNFDFHDYPGNSVFVFEPAVNLELNVTTFFRINAGISYRLVRGVDKFALTNDDLSGVSINLALKFGSF